jgi:AcrR family transcriptional regulator
MRSEGRPVPARLRRKERRGQILAAATRAFARTGFAATSLDDVAVEAGISRAILYRHFESKTDLYRAVLQRARNYLAETVGTEAYSEESVARLLHAAAAEPDAFRLLFHHAAREPEFRDEVDRLRGDSTQVAYRYLSQLVPNRAWARWASDLTATVASEGVIAWLDAGQPDADEAASRILRVLGAIVDSARAQEERSG